MRLNPAANSFQFQLIRKTASIGAPGTLLHYRRRVLEYGIRSIISPHGPPISGRGHSLDHVPGNFPCDDSHHLRGSFLRLPYAVCFPLPSDIFHTPPHFNRKSHLADILPLYRNFAPQSWNIHHPRQYERKLLGAESLHR